MDYLAKARLHLAQHPARPAILVLGGSFNPIHNAHIQMFISAAEALRQNGMDFVGGFIAVASDHHVSKKDASLTIPAELRFQLCSAATMSSAAISVIPHVEGSAREAAHRISRELGHGVEDFVLCGADMLHIKGTYDKAAIVVIERDAVPFSDQMRLARSMLPKRTIVARADSRCACISSTAIRGLISQGDWTFASLMLDPAVCSPQPCTITSARVLTVAAVSADEARAAAQAKSVIQIQGAKAVADSKVAAKAKAAAKAQSSADDKAAADAANFSQTIAILQNLNLHAHIPAFVKEDISNTVLPTMSVEELKALGLSLGNAKLVKTKIDALKSCFTGGSAADASSAGHPSASCVQVMEICKLTAAAAAQLLAINKGDVQAAIGHHFLHRSSPTPSSTSLEPRTLASSNFKRAHAGSECPQLQHQLFGSIHQFILHMCRRHSQPAAAANDFFQRLQGESFENPKELLSQIQVAATRIWTSTQRLQGCGVDAAFNVEFCSLINRALRDDDAEAMPHLIAIVRAINALCIVRRDEVSSKFPPNAVCHRGGALPEHHRAFFTAGKKYRVPMYLATSFSEDKAYEFWYRSFASGQLPVHWIVHVDARGEHTLRYRCKNVNLVEKTVKGVEDEMEFLFVPYSVFKVISVHVPPKITGDNPVTICIEAAIDNANEDEELPLSPWH